MLQENEISSRVIEYCIKIHKNLGPGLLESVYEEALCYELKKNSIQFERQKEVAVMYEEIKLELGFRADIIVENKVIIEIKSIEQLSAVHKKQLLTYLKLTGLKLGLLINFNVLLLKDGIIRIANNL